MGLASGGGPAPGGLTADVQPNACVCSHHTWAHTGTHRHACMLHAHTPVCNTDVNRDMTMHTRTHTHAHTQMHMSTETQEWITQPLRQRAHLPAPPSAPATVQPSDCVRETKLPRTAHGVPGWLGRLGGGSASPGGSPLPWCLPAAPSAHRLAVSLGPWLLSLG